jgi:hypothetical protein
MRAEESSQLSIKWNDLFTGKLKKEEGEMDKRQAQAAALFMSLRHD